MKSLALTTALALGVAAFPSTIAFATDNPSAPRDSVSAWPAACISLCGDVNFSGSVTSADVITLVNHVFKTGSLALPECADVDDYAGIDAADIVFLINRVLKGGPAPTCPPGNPAYTPAVDSGSRVQIHPVHRDPLLDTNFSILVSAQLGEPVAALTIPLTFGANAGIKVDSSVLTGPDIRGVTYESLGKNSGWTIKSSRIDQTNHTILLGFVSFSSVGPASGSLARVHFVPTSQPDTFATVLDTITIPPHNGLSFTTTGALNKRPNFVPGEIFWDGPTIVQLHVGYPEDAYHLTTSTPWIAWSYHTLSGLPQTAYELECGTDQDWLVAELWQPGQVMNSDTGITYAGNALVPGQVNYCRLRISDGTDWSAWSESAFRLIGPPNAPEPVRPLSGECLIDSDYTWLEVRYSGLFYGDSITTEFNWFRVTASHDTLLLATSPWLPNFPNTNWVSWQPPETLLEDSLYFWTARASNGYYTSPSSAPEWYSCNMSNQPPEPARIVGPKNDSIVYSCSPALTWHVGTDPDVCDRSHLTYAVERAESDDFSQGWVGTAINDPLDTSIVLGPALSVATRYWWLVYVTDADSAFAPATAQRFRVYDPGDLDASWFVTSADIITLVNYVFRGNALQVPSCAAEVTGDGVVTASDVIRVVNFVFKGGVAPLATCCEGPR